MNTLAHWHPSIGAGQDFNVLKQTKKYVINILSQISQPLGRATSLSLGISTIVGVTIGYLTDNGTLGMAMGTQGFFISYVSCIVRDAIG